VGKVGIQKSSIAVDSRLQRNDNIDIFWTYVTTSHFYLSPLSRMERGFGGEDEKVPKEHFLIVLLLILPTFVFLFFKNKKLN
jgi:hypothetical protein